jgi:hypothetical protein
MSITPRIAKVLRSEEVSTLVKTYNFDSLYDRFITFEKSEITKMFQDLGIDPMNYIKGDVLPSYMYYNNFNYKDAVIPGNIITIGRSAFSNSILESVDFKWAKKLANIDCSAFEKTNVKIVTLPPTLAWLRKYAFYECDMLEEIYLSPDLGMIEKSCFEGCESLRYIFMPKSVRGIENFAFSDCGLKDGLTLEFGDTVKMFNSMMMNVSSTAFKGTTVNVKCVDGGFTI